MHVKLCGKMSIYVRVLTIENRRVIMHLIMLSGGSGQRLWPLSNHVRSKQFLKILDGIDGRKESMVQRVYRQLKEVGGWDSVSVVAGMTQKEQIASQLGTEVNLIVEPSRRDTFPAIALACSYLYSKKKVKLTENIVVLPIDSYVENKYFEKLEDVSRVLGSDNAELVLLGAVPIKPSEKYGYIMPDYKDDINRNFKNQSGNKSEELDVAYFKEKPELKTAEELIQNGALWNCGVFGLKLGYVLDILKEKYGITDFSFNNLQKSFENLNKTSFDYEVVEKASNIKVIKYKGQWKDLGTWETLTEELGEATIGNATIDHLCTNTHVINELDVPIIAMGIQDSVIVASHDGILVANKGETYRLKEFSDITLDRPMCEERRWGKYIVLEHGKSSEGQEVLTKRLHIQSGKQISYQYHNNRKEIWTIVGGYGELYLDNKRREVKCGDVVVIEPKMKHGIKAIQGLEIIEVQMGDQLIEEDIIRLELEW